MSESIKEHLSPELQLMAKKVGPYNQPATDLQSLELAEAPDKWDVRWLGLAKYISTFSKDPSTQVGAVLVKDRRVISLGFNGFPQGMSDDPALYANREEKYSRVVHGEVNALIFAGRQVDGATLYTWPFAPCDRCAVQMLQAGIRLFVFPRLAPDKEERWGVSLKRSKQFFHEVGAVWVELPQELV
jgi:dCMP deaminase